MLHKAAPWNPPGQCFWDLPIIQFHRDSSVSQVTALYPVMDRLSHPRVPAYIWPTSLEQNVFSRTHNPVGAIISCAIINAKTSDGPCTQQWICAVSRVAVTKIFRSRDKTAMSHNCIEFGNGKKRFLFDPTWRLSSTLANEHSEWHTFYCS